MRKKRMNKYISKSEAVNAVNILIRKQREENCFDSVYDALTYLKGLLWQMKSMDIAHGQWNHLDYNDFVCSNCKSVQIARHMLAFLMDTGKWNYCPNCGAKMENKKDV